MEVNDECICFRVSFINNSVIHQLLRKGLVSRNMTNHSSNLVQERCPRLVFDNILNIPRKEHVGNKKNVYDEKCFGSFVIGVS